MEISGITVLARGGDEQISAVLIEERFKICASLTFLIVFQELVRRQGKIFFDISEIQSDLTVERRIIFDMCRKERFISL